MSTKVLLAKGDQVLFGSCQDFRALCTVNTEYLDKLLDTNTNPGVLNMVMLDLGFD